MRDDTKNSCVADYRLQGSRLQDSGEKLCKKKREKRAGAGERKRQGKAAPFPESRASYFRCARFNREQMINES